MYGFICPVCGNPLNGEKKAFRCPLGHSFDTAKEGYVNLLTGSRSGALTGDSAEMAKSRRSFLSKGYFDVLAKELCKIAREYDVSDGTMLDICCGEGHYSSYVKSKLRTPEILGFDLSREMIKRAAKQNKEVGYAVANMTAVPVADNSVDCAFHLFAPFYSDEFKRILSKNGILISVTAGEKHLYELKELLYETVYVNETKEPSNGTMRLIRSYELNDRITLKSSEDADALFRMTPYYYHTPADGLSRLAETQRLEVGLSFNIFIYGKGE